MRDFLSELKKLKNKIETILTIWDLLLNETNFALKNY